MKIACGERRKGVAVLVAAYFFTQGCPVLPAALTSIAADLGVRPESVGAIVSVYSAVLGTAFFFSGVLADRFSRSLLAVAGATGTALSFLFCSAAPDYWTLLAAFALLGGVVQSFYYPAASSTLATWCPERKGTVLAAMQAMLYAGAVVAAALGGWSADCGSGAWRVAFLGFGLGGVVFSAFVVGVLRPWRVTDAANGHLPQQTLGEMLRAVFSSRVFAWLVPAMGFTTAMDLGVRTWGPAFLRRVSGAGGCLSATSVVLGLSAGAIAGVLLGGPLTDRMAVNRPRARLGAAAVSLLAASAAVAVFSCAPGVAMGFACLLSVGLARGFLDATLFPAVLESVPERVRSSAMGIFLGLVYVFGSFSPSLVGWLFQSVDARLALAAVALFPLVGAVFAFGVWRAAGNLVQYVAK